MGERRQTIEDKPAVEEKPAPRQAAMPTAALAEAVKLLDQELERIARTYEAAHTLRAQVGGNVQGLLDELVTLEQRKATVAAELETLEQTKAAQAQQLVELGNAQHEQQTILTQLQADVAAAQKLRDELTALR